MNILYLIFGLAIIGLLIFLVVRKSDSPKVEKLDETTLKTLDSQQEKIQLDLPENINIYNLNYDDYCNYYPCYWYGDWPWFYYGGYYYPFYYYGGRRNYNWRRPLRYGPHYRGVPGRMRGGFAGMGYRGGRGGRFPSGGRPGGGRGGGGRR